MRFIIGLLLTITAVFTAFISLLSSTCGIVELISARSRSTKNRAEKPNGDKISHINMDLSHQPWLAHLNYSLDETDDASQQLSEKESKLFRPRLSAAQVATLTKLLDAWANVTAAANVTWWISFGSLLGSYRHHGLIPWDDDVDVEVPEEHMERLAQMAGQLQSEQSDLVFDTRLDGCRVCVRDGVVRHKFYTTTGTRTRSGVYAPYIDVFYYSSNSTAVWGDMHPATPPGVVFPLLPRPFCGRLLPAPRDPWLYLSKFMGYKLSDCYSGGWSHVREMGRPAKLVVTKPCQSLLSRHSFVSHTREAGGGGCKETLQLNGTTLATWRRHATDIPVC